MSENNTSGGIGVFTVVFIVFLVLKLLGHFPYSWFWVFSPVLIPIGIILFLLFMLMLGSCIDAGKHLVSSKNKSNKKEVTK